MNQNKMTKFKITTRNLKESPPSTESAKLLKYETALQYMVLPLHRKENRLWVSMQDPFNYNTIADLQTLTGLFVEPVLSEEQDIRYFINLLYSSTQIENIASQFLVDENIRKNQYQLNTELQMQIDSAPVVQLVDSLIESAVLYSASDIHIEPYEHILRARFRVDGQLVNTQNISRYMLPNIISRLKIMANMDIIEKRLPQDGSFSLTILDKIVDFRLSTMPTKYGEKAVLRLLYNHTNRFDITKLGFFKEDLKVIDQLFKNPHGAIIITGPTGSGKSTTLSCFMSELNQPNVNIITLEDPIENPIEGINHTAIDPKAGLTFPYALKHILRQDPDIIMVGEIRDAETASIAVRAAITGHLLLSTLHTNDASGAFLRLLDMGIPPYLVAACLNGIIAQRLVRRLCPFCKKLQTIDDTASRLLNIRAGTKIYHADGCNQCSKTGYKGRFALYEYIVIDDNIRRNMTTELKPHVSMLQNGVKNIMLGNTSASEVVRMVLRS